MRKSFTLGILALCLAALPLQARPGGNFGLGFQLGDPSGLSGKYWLSSENAVDMLLGFSPYRDWVFAKADYLWHFFNVIPVASGRVPLYIGPGAMTYIHDSRVGIGIELAGGIAYMFPSIPIDVFLNVGIGAFIVPATDGSVNAGIGARFYF
jgi:hypothetical protein